MLSQIHFLLTYTCNFQCDHCFLYCGPRAAGTFTMEGIGRVLEDARKVPAIDWVYFEGGEPFLYYPLMVEGIRTARAMGFEAGIVTNGYWATSAADAELWLRPLVDLGVADIGMSEDTYHYGDRQETPVKAAMAAAEKLGLPAAVFCIERPAADGSGGPKFRGRAADTLTDGLPRRPWRELTTCPYEDLADPERVHVDPEGGVHLCQGLLMGNLFETPLADLLAAYRPEEHPVVGPLLAGGPAELARCHGVEAGDTCVDECHLCFEVRRALLDRFPQFLGPAQVYGR